MLGGGGGDECKDVLELDTDQDAVTAVFRLVVQKLRRESAHAHTFG